MDTELQAEYGGGNLELRKDKTATLKTNQQSNAFTWKMNKEALELYKEGKSSPDIIFFPSVDGADLMYMKGIDVISAKMVFPADNTAIIVALKK